MRLVMLRHASTPGNEERRYVGRRTDEPLSDVGMAQCEAAGVWPSVRVVYVSPLVRARQTASICFPQARQIVVEGLAEFDFGEFEGRTAQQMENDLAYRAWVDGGCVDACPGGDSLASYEAHVKAAMLWLLRNASSRGEDEAFVVAHGGTIMAALDGFYHKHVGNCEGYVATVQLDGERMIVEDERRIRALKEFFTDESRARTRAC